MCLSLCEPAYVCEAGACVSRSLGLQWVAPGDGAGIAPGPTELRLLLVPYPGRAQADPEALPARLAGPDGGSATLSLARDDGGYSTLVDLSVGAWTASAQWGPLTATQSFEVRDGGLDAGAPDAGVRDAGPCSQDWCLVHPLPQADDLESVWGSSPTDVWAVGWGGAVLHFDGARWTPAPGAPLEAFKSVWGFGPNDVWAVGLGGITSHWDGTRWTTTTLSSQHLWGVWGSSPSDVWAVGAGSVARHWDGTQWAFVYIGAEPSDVLRSVWGTGPNDVWVAGAATMRHWNGTTWQGVAAANARSLRHVWGRAANDVWAVGGGGTIDHWDGVAWQAVPSGTTLQLESVGGDATNLWVTGQQVLLRWNGAAFQPEPSGRLYDTLLDVWQTSPTEAWVVGTSGAIARWNGTSWATASDRGSAGLYALGGSGPADLLGVGRSGNAVHFDGGGWAHQPAFFDPNVNLTDVWVLDPTHAWAVGNGGAIYRWDGATWARMTSGTAAELRGIWGTSATDIWAAGSGGTIVHWDGTSWSPSVSGTTTGLNDVYASGPNDAWAVGSAGLMLRWNGTRWATQPVLTVPQANLFSVHGSGPNNVWVAGSLGSLLRFDGLTWLPFQVSAFEYFLSVRTLGRDDAFATGADGAVYRWDGQRLVKLPAPYRGSVWSVWMDRDQVSVSGNDGRIYVLRR